MNFDDMPTFVKFFFYQSSFNMCNACNMVDESQFSEVAGQEVEQLQVRHEK